MAKVLQNFLIGVGLDTEQYDKGAKGVESSLGRMRTLVGFTGAAMVGAFAAAGGMAINASKRIDDLGLAAEGLKTSPAYIYAYGRALAALGGDADNALAAIKSIEDAQTNLKLKGMLGPLEDVALARGDINALMDLPSGAEFLRTLAPMVQNMDKNQQQLTQRTLGLTDDVMRSLRGGVEKHDAGIARAAQLLGSGFADATEDAREFNKEWAELDTRFQGITDALADKMLPAFTGVLGAVNGFIDQNRSLIQSAGDIAAKSPVGSTLAAAAVGAGALGSTMTAFGMGGIGGRALMGTSVPGMAIGAGLIAKDVRPEDIEGLTGFRPSDYIFDTTPLDAARDAYNAVAGKYGFSTSGKDSGAISYLEGGYDRFSDQSSDFDSYLRDYANSGGAASPAESYSAEAPATDYLPLNQHNVNPLYAGGEVSNAEAAQASPEVIMVQGQRQQADRPLMPQRVTVQNHLEANLTLDGRALETKITDVVERRERTAADDLISSVDR